jgi:ADP-heptose:LPS heptosyltransferase
LMENYRFIVKFDNMDAGGFDCMKPTSYLIQPTDRILYLRLSAIGDVVNAIPGLVALRKSYPNNFIAWCVQEDSADILRGHPMIDELIVLKSHWRKNILSHDFRSIVKQLRDLKFTVVVDAHNQWKSALLAWLSGAPIRVGQVLPPELEREKYRRFLLNVINDAPLPNRDTAAERRTAYLACLGADVSHPQYVLPPLDAEKRKVDELLRGFGINPEDHLVAFNPCAKPSKRWPGSYFSELGQMLIEAYNVKILWTAAPHEKAYVQSLAEPLKRNSYNLAGLTTLRELAALYQRVNLLVTGDTGPMHIGAAAGAYIAAIMKKRSEVFHNNHEPMAEKKIVIRPDASRVGEGAGKLSSITPSQVFEEIKAVFKAEL